MKSEAEQSNWREGKTTILFGKLSNESGVVSAVSSYVISTVVFFVNADRSMW